MLKSGAVAVLSVSYDKKNTGSGTATLNRKSVSRENTLPITRRYPQILFYEAKISTDTFL